VAIQKQFYHVDLICYQAKSRIPPGHSAGTLSIVPQIDDLPADTGFTLSVYAPDARLAWIQQAERPPYTTRVDGTLTSKNSGGNARYPSFMLNPQYSLRIKPTRREQTALVTLLMQTTREVPVNIAVVWSQGERIFEYALEI
jgi:calpain-7